MEAFKPLTSMAVPYMRQNIDTDIIIPARFLKTIKRTGLGEGAFYTVRYKDDGSLDPDSAFNQPRYKDAKILVTGDNFGCGSSREHAAWGLADLGFKVIIATSFSDIFSGNAFKNGILLITLSKEQVEALAEDAIDGEITVDLEDQKIIRPNQQVIKFDYDPFKKHCLLNGLDEIGLTLGAGAAIDRHEAKLRAQQPWLFAS